MKSCCVLAVLSVLGRYLGITPRYTSSMRKTVAYKQSGRVEGEWRAKRQQPRRGVCSRRKSGLSGINWMVFV